MNIGNNDLIRIFEAYYRYKELYGKMPMERLRYCIYAGIAGLECGENEKKRIIEESILDFESIAQTIRGVYNSEYLSPTNTYAKAVEKNIKTKKDILSLDEAIKEYGLPRRIKDPKWRKMNPSFPYHQPTGNRGKVLVYRSEIESYIESKQ